jgi:hypothetical protein
MCQELQIFALVYIYKYIYIYLDASCLFRLCGSDFGITAVDDITIWITCSVFCFHIALISFASSRYFFFFFGYYFGEIVCVRDSYVYQKTGFVVLFMKVVSGRLEGSVLSVIMLRFQYSLKLSFSSTLAGVYL